MPTKEQFAQIHIAAKALKLSAQVYQDILYCNFQVDSSKHLSDQDVPRLLNIFRGLGWQPGMTVKKPTPRKAIQQKEEGIPYAGRKGSHLQYPVANDAEGLILPDQRAAIKGLTDFLGWHEQGKVGFAKRIIKKAWPQTHADGQKMLYALVSIAAEKLLFSVESLVANCNVTEWERGFLSASEFSAEKELRKYVAAKNARGHRTMPRFSMIKLLEIINKRGMDLKQKPEGHSH